MVDLDVLDREAAKVKAFFWNLSDPLVQLYNKIEYLAEIAEAANIRKSPAQVINFGL